MTAEERFAAARVACPLVAILRGVQPEEIVGIADVLVAAGFSMIEIPLNSPEALDSIAAIAQRYPEQVVIGAGTVLTRSQVQEVREAGGRLIVSPNTNPQVIRETVSSGMISLPGYATPSEAFAALDAGAHGLKLFPAEAASPEVLGAHRAVLPKEAPVLVVGGILPDTLAPWAEKGADGFGLGSGLYKPGMSASEVAARADKYVDAIRSVSTTS